MHFQVAILLALVVSSLLHCGTAKTIILNEEDITGSCTSRCNELPTIQNVRGCKTLSSCKLSREGWNRGSVRCENCECECEEDAPPIPPPQPQQGSGGWWNRGVWWYGDGVTPPVTPPSTEGIKPPPPTQEFFDINEDELFGTCTGTCNVNGLVKTNFRGYKVRVCMQIYII